jgi:hypothetical protein
VLKWLHTNCTTEASTYWLLKERGDERLQLYNLSALHEFTANLGADASSSSYTPPGANDEVRMMMMIIIIIIIVKICIDRYIYTYTIHTVSLSLTLSISLLSHTHNDNTNNTRNEAQASAGTRRAHVPEKFAFPVTETYQK